MTLPQILAFAVIVGMMGLFVWGRLRYDVVGMLALFASVVVGIVPAGEAFKGFGDDIVIIVGSALIVSTAVARSGIVEAVLQKVGPYLTSPRKVIVLLVGSVTLMAGFVKNIGALAMLMPVAFQLARRTKTSPSYFLMPMAFGSLLGGTMTLIGTSPNVIVSRLREDLVGEPFHMFDFMPVGLSIAVIGVIFLAFGYKLLPADRKGAASLDAALSIQSYTTEAKVPEDSPLVGKTVADLEKRAEGEVQVVTIIRERFRRFTPSPNWTLLANDTLLLEGESNGPGTGGVGRQAEAFRRRGTGDGDRHERRGFRRHGSRGHPRFQSRRPHADAGAAGGALPDRGARGKPQRRAADATA